MNTDNETRESLQTNCDENFGKWQPIYADHGVPTFPVVVADGNKKPAVRNWNRTTPNSSKSFAIRFADAESFGFPCGRASRITVVDMDSTDAAILDEGRKLFGESPLVWQTGSGKYAMAFRHSGEKRMIRPIKGLPIDLLGGGYAVAPPSIGSHQRYQIIRGTLDDLERLPVANIPAEIAARNERAQRRAGAVAGRAAEGQRHELLKAHCMASVWYCDDFDALLDCAMNFAKFSCDPPLEDHETISMAKWVWNLKEKGWLHRPGHRHWSDDQHDLDVEGELLAARLLSWLRHNHPGERQEFVVANAMAKSMHVNRENFAKARELLVVRGLLRLIKSATNKEPALFGWPR